MPNQRTDFSAQKEALIQRGYLTQAEAAQRIKVPLRTLHAWVTQGKIDVIRVSPRIVLFDPAVVEARRVERIKQKRDELYAMLGKETK